MKKIISLLIILVLFLGNINLSSSYYKIQENHKKIKNISFEKHSPDCKTNNHKCCFENSNKNLKLVSLNTQNTNKTEKIKLKSLDNIFLKQEKIFENILIKLNSPPKIIYKIKNKSYTSLTWIIKINC